ncbi:DUF4351 domain-containing protein [Duganella radicis]|nr:DUF4351 domain-containing protein [Duganella radicis]
MPNTVPSARYDLPWKAVLKHALRAFLDFYFPDFSARIDWRQRPRFRDKEFARSGFSGAPNVMVADILAEVRMRDGRQGLVHIEIQTQRDATMAKRMHDYNYRISETYDLPLASLVLLADEYPRWRPASFDQQFEGTATAFSFGSAKLLDYVTDIEALEASSNPVAWLTLAHWRSQQAHHDPKKLYAAKLHLTALLFRHGWNKKRILVLFDAINWMMTLPEPYQRRYWQAARKLGKEHEMKLLNPLEQMFFDDGIKKGLEQGLEQGRREGAVVLLERLLVKRFGPLSQTTRKKLATASLAQLEAWSDALDEAQSLKQIWE